ncbi:hypothetical protein HK097_002147 [Rhizophlyctis rosea]|uniref:Oxidoreductase FAD/NAD(P)-binding domain-containing protein n=1 Tax=Rhizophlyctis rosea TaxID=64517 RepID=A0AAD5S5Z6_9FUNG|nr:hypothetical protein HK097_002147 [Rhizophlyctis rosea]
MPEQHSTFFSNLQYFALATTDSYGRPWATIVTGQPGQVVQALSKNTLAISTALPPGDPVGQCFETRKAILWAGLGVDFTNRRRNKVAGIVKYARANEGGKGELELRLETNESLGNCPKYITIRDLTNIQRTPQLITSQLNSSNILLTPDQKALINQASTVFLATRHFTDDTTISDMGLNHRGGSPGFVRTYNDSTSTYIILPDFSGNRFYQSLGNIQTDHYAGLVIPDFTTGDILHITGEAENLFDDEAESIMPRITLLTRIKITGLVHIKEGLNLRLNSPEQYSPYNPPIRYLTSELTLLNRPSSTPSNSARLTNINRISQNISTFTFTLEKPVTHLPGHFAIFDFSPHIHRTYAHMNEQTPQQVNDDFIRTWTISSAPPISSSSSSSKSEDSELTFGETTTLQCTIKHVALGAVTHFLHSLPAFLSSEIVLPFLGTGGDFSCFEMVDGKLSVPKKMVWIAAGVGITPFLAFYEALKKVKGIETDIVLLFAARGDESIVSDVFAPLGSGLVAINVRVFNSAAVEGGDSGEGDWRRTQKRRMTSVDIAEVPDVTDRVAYMCGPGGFMKDVAEWLAGAGVKGENIKKEEFAF